MRMPDAFDDLLGEVSDRQFARHIWRPKPRMLQHERHQGCVAFADIATAALDPTMMRNLGNQTRTCRNLERVASKRPCLDAGARLFGGPINLTETPERHFSAHSGPLRLPGNRKNLLNHLLFAKRQAVSRALAAREVSGLADALRVGALASRFMTG